METKETEKERRLEIRLSKYYSDLLDELADYQDRTVKNYTELLVKKHIDKYVERVNGNKKIKP